MVRRVRHASPFASERTLIAVIPDTDMPRRPRKTKRPYAPLSSVSRRSSRPSPEACVADDAEIGELYGPVSFALLPLSTGSSLPFLRTILSISLDQYTMTSSQHCSPGDALELHRIMKSARTLGIHWGTFCDSHETRGTRIEFGRERRKRGVSGAWSGGEAEKGRFVTANIGETLVIPK